MLTLRLTHQAETQPDHYRVEVALEGDDLARQTATVRFSFALDAQDQERIRWYLEDYLEHPFEPEQRIAARIEKRMADMGTELFGAVFRADDDARDLWATLRTRLNDTRVEVIAGVQEATAIPWELIRDPKTDAPLALRARAFVRAQPQAAQRPRLPRTETGPVRILLVICRPGAHEDVPFRSVASRLIKGLSSSDRTREAFQLDVLRPPTFEQMARVLRAAQGRGEPYHIVHFDGHGAFLDMARLFADWKDKSEEELMQALAELVHPDPHSLSPEAICLQTPRAGRRGYLAFENPTSAGNLCLVDGSELGKLLVGTDVPVLVLNACRSAHAEAPEAPQEEAADVHSQVRAFGSLAQEVIDAGVVGVVAMRYNVYVVTAAQFVADLYASLAQGHPLGQAVTFGRKQLHAQPQRTIAYDPRPLQDWPVPVVYEAAPIALFPKPADEVALTVTLQAGDAAPERGALDPSLPPRPDAGFFGRDETLLALDRAFDAQSIVLLHAYAGSGKTATAAEFGRWYALTGGVNGPVLFTSFEQYKPLARVLDQMGQMFEPLLERSGIQWLALSNRDRRNVALQVMQQIPVLWVWDNVEPVAGFPAGADSAWSAAEQQELVDFLRAARETRARFLLTSRRDEQGWLGKLPARVTLPPMPMQERVQLARALAEKHGHRLSEVEDWRPLLRFSQGNPLTITVTVGQALRDRLVTRDQIEAFVAQLRAGEAEIEDEESEGRARSLGASLSYGFEHAFSQEERAQLAVLHFFQGFVDVDALRMMGGPEEDYCLPQVRGLTHEAGMALLDRAAEVGLLTAHGGGYYTIHPALPWYLKALFEQHYPLSPTPSLQSPVRAYVEVMGALGNYYAAQYEGGNRDVIGVLGAEEANLLHARQLARRHGWWGGVVSAMQGLRKLYGHTGRRAEWARLVEEIVPDVVDPGTDGPLPGREEDWDFITHYRVLLAEEARKWAEAERLQRVLVEWNRQRAAPALAVSPETLDDAQRNAVRSLAASLHELGEIQRELGQSECVTTYEEATTLLRRIGDQPAEAVVAINLGYAYLSLPALRDLAQAERWYRRSLELTDERDRLGRSRCLSQLGLVAYERFEEARAAKRPEEELLRHLNDAVGLYHQALTLTPPDAVDSLAVRHNQLGVIYRNAGDLDRALSHYRECIRYDEVAGNLYGAAQTRFNVALALWGAGRLSEAWEYADAARRNFQAYGDRAADEIQETERLIADIERDRRET